MDCSLIDIVRSEVRDMYLKHLAEPVPWRQGRARTHNPRMYTKLPERDSILYSDDCDLAKVWVWSDQHFGHKNIISYSDRPYGGLDHMHQELLKNYKMCVGPDDICIWVGDVAFMKDAAANHLLSAYPGYKILVAGNHDFEKKQLKSLNVDEVHLTLTLQVAEDLYIAFTHYPLEKKLPHPLFKNMGVEVYNIHGHTHDRNIPDPRLFNVSVENIDYTPNVLGQTVRIMEERVRNED